MRTTIDAAGRIVVPKAMRDRLGFIPRAEIEVEVVDGHLEVSVPSRVRVEDGPGGPRFVVDGDAPTLDVDDVRRILEEGRR